MALSSRALCNCQSLDGTKGTVDTWVRWELSVPRVPPLRITIIVMQPRIKYNGLTSRRRKTNIDSDLGIVSSLTWSDIKENPWNPPINKNLFEDCYFQMTCSYKDYKAAELSQISQHMKHFLDRNIAGVFASCRSVWKGCSRSVTDSLVFITDFIGLNLCSVHGTNSQDEQSRARLIVLFDLLPLITSLSDFIYFALPSLMPRDTSPHVLSNASLFVFTVHNLQNAANHDKRLKCKFLSQFARVPFSYLIWRKHFPICSLCLAVMWSSLSGVLSDLTPAFSPWERRLSQSETESRPVS